MTHPTKKLGEICEVVGGGTPKTGASAYWSDEVPWVTPKDLGQLKSVEIFDTNKKISKMGLEKSSAKLLPKGSIVLSSRAPIGYVAIAGVELATNQGCRNFVCGEKIFNKFLYYYLTFNTALLNSLGGGSTFKEVSGSKLKEIEIPLPPLEEQKRIVKVLEGKLGKVKEAIKLRQDAIADTEKILSAKLTEIFKEGKEKGWEKKEIHEISKQIKSGFACGKQNEVDEGIVHLRTHNISLSGEINLNKIVKIPKKFVDTDIFNLKKDDIIFNNTNSAELVGKSIYIREDLPYTFSNHLTRIRFNQDIVLPKWILYVFQKYWSDKVFEKICTRWIGQAGINQTTLKKIIVPIPDLKTQEKIVKELDELSAHVAPLRVLQEEQLENLKSLERAYLQEAFAN